MDNTLYSRLLHQPLHRAAVDIEAFPTQLSPYLAHAVDLEVIVPDPLDFRHKLGVPPDTIARSRRIAGRSGASVVCRWGDRQNPADRLDPMLDVMIVNEGDHRLNGRSSIRLGQGRSVCQSRPSRSSVFARTTMRRMTAVMATFFAFPAFSRC